ncbi:hypothetical protein [Salinirubrum litoreum]|uniref:Metallo-peptidase family M12B Reprolysin-like n=1 Tax=Salinirubrum litoreum TaxID=1126234 RepID=A0ABD5RFS3_9EURY|nr:hypothetical protein [Salinirubrum litoreum]
MSEASAHPSLEYSGDDLKYESATEIKLVTASLDDFDFVTAEQSTRSGIYENVSFSALDGTNRTDTWLANAEEARAETDVWDPDTDDDGLTDGQELKWITTAEQPVRSVQQIRRASVGDRGAVGTSATSPDSDGDGYWDGWIGVYGVERTDNVVLYQEHLRDDDDGDGDTADEGVKDEETVPEQAGVHRTDQSIPSPEGVVFEEGEPPVHSNLHIGELQWGSDPTSSDDSPAPSLTIEVDYYEADSTAALNTEAWERGIERNFRLYGIDVDIVRDDVISDEQFIPCLPPTAGPLCVDPENGFGIREIIAAGTTFSSTGSDEYVIVGTKAGGTVPGGQDQSGINLYGVPYQGIFVQGNAEDTTDVSNRDLERSPYSTKVAMVSAKTEIHEIGHSFGVGRADDRYRPRTVFRNGEIYSGSISPNSRDWTPENLDGTATWSIMSSGYNEDLANTPMNGRFFAFSIEETSTADDE